MEKKKNKEKSRDDIELTIKRESVQANPRKLKGKWTMKAVEDLQMYDPDERYNEKVREYNKKVPLLREILEEEVPYKKERDTLVDTMSKEIAKEIDKQIINEIKNTPETREEIKKTVENCVTKMTIEGTNEVLYERKKNTLH